MSQSAVALTLLVCRAISLCAADSGEQPAQPAKAANESVTTERPDLANWWDKNAMKIKPLPAAWLRHAEGTLSYANSSGNASGSTLDLNASADLRKGRFTNHIVARLNRTDVVYGDQGAVSFVERTLREQLDFDPAESITFFAAIESYRNTLTYLDRRVLIYAGLGGRIFRNDKAQLVVNGAVGHASFGFDRHQLSLVNPGQVGSVDPNPRSGGAVATQSWRWKVSPRFNFSEDASYIKYLNSRLGDRWTFDLNGSFPLDKWFSLNVAYRFKDENNSIIRALRVFPRDRSVLIGIKASM